MGAGRGEKEARKNSFTFDASASPNGHDGIRGIQQQEQLQDEENEVEEEPVPTTKKRKRKRKYGDDDCDGRKLVGDAKDLHSKTSKILEVYNHH